MEPKDTSDPKPSFTLCPIVRITGDRRKPLEYTTELTLHWCRFLWIVLFSVCFYFTVSRNMSDSAVMSGEVTALLSEVFPDQSVTGERMTKSEIANAWDQQLDGDGVSKILNWFQAFCMYKRGSDEHVTWAWSCDIGRITVGKLHPVPWDVIHDSIPYNISQSKNFVNHICSNKFLFHHVIFGDDPRQVPFGDVEALRKLVAERSQKAGELDIVGKIFAPVWDEWAVLDGNPMLNIIKKGVNDQLDEREAAKKQEAAEEASLLQSRRGDVFSLIEAHSGVLGRYLAHHQPSQRASGAHDVHDEKVGINREITSKTALTIFNELSQEKRALMKRRAGGSEGARGAHDVHDEKFGINREITSKIALTVFNELSQEKRALMKRRASGSVAEVVEAFSEMSTQPTNPDENEVSRHSENDKSARDATESEPMHDSDQESSELPVEPDYGDGELHAGLAGMPDFCFNRFAPELSKIMNKWRDLGMNSVTDNKELSMDEFDFLLKNMRIRNSWRKDLTLRADADKSGTISYSEILQVVKSNRSAFMWNGTSVKDDHTTLLPTCRNHHWGMIHLCGPERFSVAFRIERGNSEFKQESLGRRYRRDFVDVTFNYEQIGYQSSDPTSATTGWYRATIDTQVYNINPKVGWVDLILGVFTLVLFASLFLLELVWTVLRWPYTMYELLAPSKRAEVTKLVEVKAMLTRFIDGRGVRPHFMGMSFIVMEHICALVFVIAMIDSALEAMKPSMRMEGAKMPHDKCRDHFERQLIDWMAKGSHKDGEITAANDFDFISPLDYIWYCSPEDEGINIISNVFFRLLFVGDQLFGLALFVVAFRLLDILNISNGTKWLTDTLELSAEKLAHFLLFYIIVIYFFAILLRVTFGELFPQFHTVLRACFVLINFTFGTTEFAWEGIKTFEHAQSRWLTTYLLIFSITIISVAMQFFTTIVLDAYATVMNPEKLIEYHRQQKVGSLVRVVANYMFPQVSKTQTNVLPPFRKSDERLARGMVLTGFLQGLPAPPGTAADAEAIEKAAEQAELQA